MFFAVLFLGWLFLSWTSAKGHTSSSLYSEGYSGVLCVVKQQGGLIHLSHCWFMCSRILNMPWLTSYFLAYETFFFKNSENYPVLYFKSQTLGYWQVWVLVVWYKKTEHQRFPSQSWFSNYLKSYSKYFWVIINLSTSSTFLIWNTGTKHLSDKSWLDDVNIIRSHLYTRLRLLLQQYSKTIKIF